MVSIIHWLILLVPVLLLGLVIWLFVRRRGDPPTVGGSARVTHSAKSSGEEPRP